MSEYRNEIRDFEKEGRWTVFKLLPLFILIVVVLGGTGFITKSLGLWGGTIVERKVFEESYQRSESIKARIANDEAVLAEINRKLSNSGLENSTRHNLEAQAAAARIRISTAKGIQ